MLSLLYRSLRECVCEGAAFLPGVLYHPLSVLFHIRSQRQRQQCGWAGVRRLRRTEQTEMGAGPELRHRWYGVVDEPEEQHQPLEHHFCPLAEKVCMCCMYHIVGYFLLEKYSSNPG